MTLMRYCSYKLSKQEIENWSVLNGEKKLQTEGHGSKEKLHAQRDHLFLLQKGGSGMNDAFYTVNPDGKIQALGYRTLFCIDIWNSLISKKTGKTTAKHARTSNVA